MSNEQESKNMVENLCDKETPVIGPYLTGISKGDQPIQDLGGGGTQKTRKIHQTKTESQQEIIF